MFGDSRTKINGLNIVNVNIPGTSGAPGVIQLAGQEPSGTAYAIWGPGSAVNAVIKLPPEDGLCAGYSLTLCMIPQGSSPSSPSSAIVSVANTATACFTAVGGPTEVEINEGFPITFVYWGQTAGARTGARLHYWSATVGVPAGLMTGNWSTSSSTQARTALSNLSGALALGTNAKANNINAMAVGTSNTASSTGACAIGGVSNTASGQYTFANGTTNTASGDYSFARGNSCTASGTYSIAQGMSVTTQGIHGKDAYSATTFGSVGTAQTARMVLRKQTTNATPVALVSDAGAASTTNQVILPNDSSYICRVNVVARDTSTGDIATWDFNVAIKRGANAAATALVGSPTTTQVFGDAGAAAWTIAATADTTNGGLAITATGEAAKTINWVSTVWTTEVSG